MGQARQLVPFAALSASYFAHIGFFNPYLPLWLKEMGLSLVTISLLMSLQAATRLFAPYGWGWLSDHTGERVKLLRYGATAALVASLGLWHDGGVAWLFGVLLLMFTHTSGMMSMSEAAMAHLVSRAVCLTPGATAGCGCLARPVSWSPCWLRAPGLSSAACSTFRPGRWPPFWP